MKEFFGLRLGLIAFASVMLYFIMDTANLLWLKLTFEQFQTTLWLAISMTWLIGLVIVKWQFGKLANPGTPNHKDFSFQEFLNQQKQKQKQKPGTEKTIFEQAKINNQKIESNRGEEPIQPGQIREISNEKKANMRNIVEGIVGESLADAELALTLELTKGEELTVFGQKCKVKQGKVTIRPRKTKSRKIEDMFDKHKTRVRKT